MSLHAAGPVQICFAASDAWVSRAICWLTYSKISHVLITFYDVSLGQVMVVQADRGFQVVPWKKWCEGNSVVARYTLPAPADLQLDVLQEVVEYLGASHSTRSLLKLLLLRRRRRRYKGQFSPPGKRICAEAAALYLQKIGLLYGSATIYTSEDLLALLAGTVGAELVQGESFGA